MTVMSVRIPDDMHDRLTKVAKARHMSVNAALTQAAEQWITTQTREQLAQDAVEKVFANRGDLFERLSDA